MATRKYTRAEWERIQARLPKEDREPYSSSPMVPEESIKENKTETKRETDRDSHQAASPVSRPVVSDVYAHRKDKRVTLPDTVKPDADPLAALQKSVTESKAQVQKKDIEILTIALERAISTGDIDAIQTAATELGKAKGLTGSDLREFVYTTAQSAAKGVKPTPPPADSKFTYDYVWRQDVGGPGGKWVLVKTPNTGPADWIFDSNGMLFYKGKAFTGNYQGINYVDGKPPGYKESGGGGGGTGAGTGAGTGVRTGAGTGVGTGAGTAAKTATNTLTSTQQDVMSIVLNRLNRYNLGSLAPLIKNLAIEGASEATIMLRLQDEPLYQERFRANQDRIKKGISVLTPSEYLNLEDSYRQILRAYGLKQFDNDQYVTQFISNDVSPAELSNRVVTAVQRVRNADPAVSNMLKDYYGIGQNDLVAYVLDPNQQFQKIERQVAASEIGVAAGRQGFNIGVPVAEQLAAQGITQAEAQRGYATIADILPTAEKLSNVYATTLDKYGLAEGEQETFNQLASAQRKRRRLQERETAEFTGASGLNRASLKQQLGGTY